MWTALHFKWLRLLQIAGAFQESYYSLDTSLISIIYAKPDMFDSEDNVACSFLNLQIMHVLQYSRCLHSIKHLTKPASVCLGMSVLTEWGVLNAIRHLVDADYRSLRRVYDTGSGVVGQLQLYLKRKPSFAISWLGRLSKVNVFGDCGCSSLEI